MYVHFYLSGLFFIPISARGAVSLALSDPREHDSVHDDSVNSDTVRDMTSGLVAAIDLIITFDWFL